MPKYQTLPLLESTDRGGIDPGAQACAVALSGLTYELHWVGMIAWLDSYCGRLIHRCVVERFEVVHGSDPDDLFRATAAGFLLAGRITGGDVRAVTPREWKGQTPKPAHHKRLWAALTPAERELLGGAPTLAAIAAACQRGAKDRWRKPGARYYRASELPTVRGVKITHDILDASALNLYDSGRLPGP